MKNKENICMEHIVLAGLEFIMLSEKVAATYMQPRPPKDTGGVVHAMPFQPKVDLDALKQNIVGTIQHLEVARDIITGDEEWK